MIYADHAATSALDPAALEAMRPFLTGMFANPSQPYSFARSARQALKNARSEIACCIGAEPEEIYFTSGGSESDNWALCGVMAAAPEGQGLAVSAIEHHAVLNTARHLEKHGARLHIIPADSTGTVHPQSVFSLSGSDVRLVSVMSASNELGTLEPVTELAAAAHELGALFHTDAVQALGHVPVNVRASGADLLSASAHKFNGPRGMGFLYAKKGVPIAPLVRGGMQENGMRAGTENVAGAVGMAAALKVSVSRMHETERHLARLETLLLDRLAQHGLDFMRNGAPLHVPGSLSLSFRNAEGEMLLHRLDLMGICVSTGSACDSRSTVISHVLSAIEVPKAYARGTVRVTLGHENTEADAIEIADALGRILKGSRKR